MAAQREERGGGERDLEGAEREAERPRREPGRERQRAEERPGEEEQRRQEDARREARRERQRHRQRGCQREREARDRVARRREERRPERRAEQLVGEGQRGVEGERDEEGVAERREQAVQAVSLRVGSARSRAAARSVRAVFWHGSPSTGGRKETRDGPRPTPRSRARRARRRDARLHCAAPGRRSARALDSRADHGGARPLARDGGNLRRL